MTAEELDAAISKIIISQEKPRRSKNSYFKKQYEKLHLRKFINPVKMKTAATDFFNSFSKLRLPDSYWHSTDYDHMDIWSRGRFFLGVRYSALTGRFKLLSNCVPKKDVKNRRFMKKIQSRALRRFTGKISDGSAFKRVPMKYPIFG